MKLLATIASIVITAGFTAAQPVVPVTANISVSTTWTANNVYDLQSQIYVLPGASLTIEAGTVIASTATVNGGGSLAITRGAKVFVKGTPTRPVIMTSSLDRATWVGGNPRTGTWREASSEWGNLTIMGRAYIAENDAAFGNSPAPSGNNRAAMEGLTAAFPGDPNVLYGGGDDDDDSGSISYLSLRYTGRVVGLGNELNGLSLGGVGRETEIHHVECMNNIDDGIEVWGGTVNLRYVSVWNIGDDSIDVDQGWRGKAQFGLIVQGYSVPATQPGANQGSGVGDNCFETDGAEQSDYQPVTTTTIYNFTVIGQPLDGDHAMAFRDNARVQYRNCIFMDIGERVVAFDNVDGDGGAGYGFNGTLSWANTWTTASGTTSLVNPPADPAAFYQTQLPGSLIEVRDSVFFNNNNAAAYTEANARNVFAASNDNVLNPANSPITSITRAAPVVRGGKAMVQVTSLNPRPAADALTSVATAPADGCWSAARYRGGFAPGNNWLDYWSAAAAYGFLTTTGAIDLGGALGGVFGDPIFSATGTISMGSAVTLTLSNAAPNAAAFLGFGFAPLESPFFGLVQIDTTGGGYIPLFTNGSGNFSLPLTWPFSAPLNLFGQWFIVDTSGAPLPFSASNALGLASLL